MLLADENLADRFARGRDVDAGLCDAYPFVLVQPAERKRRSWAIYEMGGGGRWGETSVQSNTQKFFHVGWRKMFAFEGGIWDFVEK